MTKLVSRGAPPEQAVSKSARRSVRSDLVIVSAFIMEPELWESG
jgi:hypothetical protein